MPHSLPPLRSLQAFEAAFRHQSYSRAADELGVTHGAISHRIRELEAFHGHRLFLRTGNEMVPTAAARQLVPQVREALEILHRAFPRITGKRRTLRISVLPSFASRWLVPRLRAFRDAHPAIAVELDARLDHAKIGPDGVDAAIRYGDGDWPNLRAERIATETLFAVCAPEYRDRSGLSGPADLERCVLLRHSWQPWTPWLQAAGSQLADPRDGPVFADAGLLIEAAAAGEGIALARSLLVQPDLAAGRLVKLWDVEVTDQRAYFFVRRNGRSNNERALDTFRDWLFSALQQDCGEPETR